MKKSIRFAVLTLAGLAAGTGAGAAETLTTSIGVTIRVTGICDIETPTPADVDFAAANIARRDIDAAGNITLICTKGVSYKIGLGDGQNFAGGRRMKAASGGDTIGYDLYTDAARTQRWGLVSTPTAKTGVGTGAGEAIPVYGRVPSVDNAAVGSYADRVLVTLEY